MNRELFYEITDINVHVDKDLKTTLVGKRAKLFFNVNQVSRISIAASQISFDVIGGGTQTFVTWHNIEFIKTFKPELLTDDFLATVEEHRKLLSGDKTSKLKFVWDGSVVRALWKERLSESGFLETTKH